MNSRLRATIIVRALVVAAHQQSKAVAQNDSPRKLHDAGGLRAMVTISGNSLHLGTFAVYLFASWFVPLVLLRFAAQRKYYFHLVPFVVGYAVLVP
jgi:hypothetical protein